MGYSIDGFAAQIATALYEYSEEVEQKVENIIESGSKEILKNLKKHPNIPERTGEYKKSFFLKKLRGGKGYVRYRLANKKYRVSHLLEHGHIVHDGAGRTKAYPHWRDAQAQAEELAEIVKKELES